MSERGLVLDTEWACFTPCEPCLYDVGLLDWTTEEPSEPEAEINCEIMSGAASRFDSMDELIERLNDNQDD